MILNSFDSINGNGGWRRLPNTNLIFNISDNDFFKEKNRYKYTNREIPQITSLGIEGWVMGELSA